MKDLNSQELPAFLNDQDKPIQLRFIELMKPARWTSCSINTMYLALRFAISLLLTAGCAKKSKAVNDGPAQVFVHPDYKGEIGLIMPYEKDFCESCNRLRVSATGKLHLCLVWRPRC
ncbi:hypothetical protein O9929_10330 [Vibrio lentus]|nr:hypothetical protein [Vibrio lentus]